MAVFGATLARAAGPAATAAEVGAARPTQRLQLVFPLAVDAAGLQRFTDEVSNPRSPLYGHYESIEALSRRFGASAVTRRRVLAYLRAHRARGVRIDVTGLFADATLNVATAERLFATPLERFDAVNGARYVAPTTEVRVPRALAGAVTGVVGLDTDPVVNRDAVVPARPQGAAMAFAAFGSSELSPSGTPSGCAGAVDSGGFTPAQYLTAYDYGAVHQAGFLGQGERVALLELDGVDSADVDTFAQCFGLPVPPIDTHLVGISSAPAPNTETTIDLEALDAAAPELSAIDVYETSGNAVAFLNAFSAPLKNRATRPAVISISIGSCEPATQEAANGHVITLSNYALDEEVASGITVVAAAGDDGSTDCISNSGVPVHQAAVSYPASSPYALAVGGTNIQLTAANQLANEIVWNDLPESTGATGGGFSIQSERQWWQTPFVHGGPRLVNHEPPRALPDVSMLADPYPGYAIYCSTEDCAHGGGWTRLGGTSIATPLMAGGLALTDQVLHAEQRPNLGLVAPLLYEAAGNSSIRDLIFRDVTQGSNDIGAYLPGGGGKPVGCCTAGPGYDEASGFGSVDLGDLIDFAAEILPNVHLRLAVSVPKHQHPVRSGRLSAEVTCSTGCIVYAGAAVKIGHSRPFAVYANDAHGTLLRSAGRAAFVLRFSPAQRRKLRAALRHHVRISATVIGYVVELRYTLRGTILNQEARRAIRITS
ncbi:MAG TPA: S53 family peptidase [Solirubrobacteraceae bacterium]|nr:S53 family peptidase [Solirubrobacteraceae bacterium]